jgi:hypothetical protein
MIPEIVKDARERRKRSQERQGAAQARQYCSPGCSCQQWDELMASDAAAQRRGILLGVARPGPPQVCPRMR